MRESRDRPPIIDAEVLIRPVRSRLVEVGQNELFGSSVAHVGDIQSQVPRQLPLHGEVPALDKTATSVPRLKVHSRDAGVIRFVSEKVRRKTVLGPRKTGT